MSHIFVDRRDGRLALYLGGDLQFDAADEARYHEPLGLIPLALAHGRASGRALRVLILGGGDGLALREVLKFGEVREAHVVDRDPEVLTLGRTTFAALNAGAFDDPRARVHVSDARDALGEHGRFDVAVCDLTYPRDLAGASVHTVDFYRRLRATLSPDGVMAVNAVSPETTPAAFGCLAATLAAAGLTPLPFAFELPSFAAEGYGRWGFLFASPRSIGDDEISAMRLPAGAGISAATVLDGVVFPAGAEEALRAAPNTSDELLCYLASATPLVWRPPFERVRLPSVSGNGPRLTVAEGFARWVREPEGRRSLETLLACVPAARRDAAREHMLDWARQAETMFREVDLRAFAEGALRRAAGLPEAWRRELAEFAARVRNGVPTMRELLEATWRVFAVFLLALLLANILFPDNAYAKGFRSRSSSSPSSASEPAPMVEERDAPFGFRIAPNERFIRVADALGRSHPSTAFMTGEGAMRQRVAPLLALTPALRLLPSGDLGYHAALRDHQLLLHPERIDVTTKLAGEHVMSLAPPVTVLGEVQGALAAQESLVERAIAEHQRWVAWTRWGATLTPGRAVQQEMAQLEAMRRSFAIAQSVWRTRPAQPDPGPLPGWHTLLPGLYFDPSRRQFLARRLDGAERHWSTDPPARLGTEERFLYDVLLWRMRTLGERQWAGIVEGWTRAYPDLAQPRPRGSS